MLFQLHLPIRFCGFQILGVTPAKEEDAVLIEKGASEIHLIVKQVREWLLEFYSDIISMMLLTFATLDQGELSCESRQSKITRCYITTNEEDEAFCVLKRVWRTEIQFLILITITLKPFILSW